MATQYCANCSKTVQVTGGHQLHATCNECGSTLG